MSSHISVNVRYLLYRKEVPRSNWALWLARHASLDVQTSKLLVSGLLPDGEVSDKHLSSIADAFEVGAEAENLRFQGFSYQGCKVLQENLRYLLGALVHGGKKAFAAELHIDPTTVSRWLNGSFEPQPSALRQIVSYFGLPANTNLSEDPIFLSAEPVSFRERRNWMHARVDAMSTTDFCELYPAFRRLLEDR